MPTDETTGAPPRKDDEEVEIVNNYALNHDPEDLIRYQGNYVAWSRDGRTVLFADPDPYKLFEKIDAAGLTSDEYVVGGIPKQNVVFLGGAFGLEAVWGP